MPIAVYATSTGIEYSARLGIPTLKRKGGGRYVRMNFANDEKAVEFAMETGSNLISVVQTRVARCATYGGPEYRFFYGVDGTTARKATD